MNPYKILGIRPNASKDEIVKAYENIVNTPDYYSDDPMEFSLDEQLGQVNEAYTFLINDIKYKEIRSLIESEQFIAAETELNLISDKKNAEWNYLKGFVMLKKGWIQAGITHLKTAAEIDPSNEEYKETLILLGRKINQIKANYARASKSNGSGGDMCGGGGGADMCGGGNSQGGGGIDPNLLQTLLGGNLGGQGNPMAGNGSPQQPNPLQGMMGGGNANPLGGMMGGGGNPLQNMLMQGMMGGGGNGMNMCGGGGRGGGMC